MNYLWIILVILAVLSPLMWFKPSSHQLKVTALRKRATELGLRVQLVPAADAREDEKTPSAVRYLLPREKLPYEKLPLEKSDSGVRAACNWTLMRGESASWHSPWKGWRWVGDEAPEGVIQSLSDILPQVSENIDAIRQDNQGLSIYWLERGDIASVDAIHEILKSI